jgi:hypothetical protein
MFREMPRERWPAGCRNWLNIGNCGPEYDSRKGLLPAVLWETSHCGAGSQARKSAEPAAFDGAGEAPAESQATACSFDTFRTTARIQRTGENRITGTTLTF